MSAFRVEHEDGIAVVTFDLPGEPVNKFSKAVIFQFDDLLDALDADSSLKGAVLISGKPDGFIAGADIEEFVTYTTAEMASAASAEGQMRFARVEKFRVPIVVAIHGACMGGGLELALSCRYRIATDHPKTVLALPETQLGLIPGLGGTQRLPRQVGLRAALDMILTGKNIRAKKALQMGLIEEMVHPAILRQIAVQRARAIAQTDAAMAGRAERRATLGRAQGAVGWLLDGTALGRAIVLRQARSMSAAKTRGNYPALPAAIQAIAAGYRPEGGFALESKLFGTMAMTPVSRQLISIFFATTALRKDFGSGGNAPAPNQVDRVAVIGTGFMGAGITTVTVQAGVPVRFKDVTPAQVGKGIAAVRDVLRERLKRRQVTRQQFDDQMLLVSGTTDYTGFGNVPLVIEAVFEDLTVKHKVLAELEPLLNERAIFATNTSTIPIADVARASRRPERVIGMHFFSPVHKMPLLEVIVTPQTASDAVTTVVNFGRKLGKTVIVVNDSPGFYVNRILAPYISEACRLLDECVPIDVIDKAMVDWGFPVGPITLLDEVGLDIAGKSGVIFEAAFGDRLRASESMARVIASGRLGRKNRQGFYLYDAKNKRKGVDQSVYQCFSSGATQKQMAVADIQERLSLAMINEAVRCLEEGVIRQARDGDIGAIFGIGFPPFRGGPLRCVDAIGAAELVRRLSTLDAHHRGRYTPCSLLEQWATTGRKIHPA